MPAVKTVGRVVADLIVVTCFRRTSAQAVDAACMHTILQLARCRGLRLCHCHFVNGLLTSRLPAREGPSVHPSVSTPPARHSCE
jgi:hypothetical protein